MRIGVVGGGVVGQATARSYLEHVDEVRVYDMLPERRTVVSLEELDACELVFICLPEKEVEVLFTHPLFNPHLSYVIKSTVPVGTTRKLAEKYSLTNLVHSPEFLTARCAMTDAQIPSRNVIGYPGWNFRSGCNLDDYIKEFTQPHEQGLATLCRLYKQRFPGVPCHVMRSDESEALKLIQNGFFAAKVSYMNEVWVMCNRLGLDWGRVRAALLADGRIAHAHTMVPGPDGRFGYGGSCLPKDLTQLIDCIEQSGASAPVCRAVQERNKLDRGEK